MWTADLLSESGADTHRLSPLFGIQLTEAQAHSGLVQPSRLGEICLVKGRDSWKKSTMERFLGPNYPYRIV